MRAVQSLCWGDRGVATVFAAQIQDGNRFGSSDDLGVRAATTRTDLTIGRSGLSGPPGSDEERLLHAPVYLVYRV
jgi:hypothetical protein